jgi:hypothetical protein
MNFKKELSRVQRFDAAGKRRGHGRFQSVLPVRKRHDSLREFDVVVVCR